MCIAGFHRSPELSLGKAQVQIARHLAQQGSPRRHLRCSADPLLEILQRIGRLRTLHRWLAGWQESVGKRCLDHLPWAGLAARLLGLPCLPPGRIARRLLHLPLANGPPAEAYVNLSLYTPRPGIVPSMTASFASPEEKCSASTGANVARISDNP